MESARNKAEPWLDFVLSLSRVSGKSMWVGINHSEPVEEELLIDNTP